MALNLKKKPQPLVKISLQMEQPAYETFSAFLIFLQEREQNPDITANEVINEIIREYLSGTAADVRGWREQQAIVPAVKHSNSAASKQNTLAVAKQPEVVVSTAPQVARASSQAPPSSPAPVPAVSASLPSSPAALPGALSHDGAPASAPNDEQAHRLEISPERQRQILHEEIRKKTTPPQDASKAT